MEVEPKPDAGPDRPTESAPEADDGSAINRKPRFTIGKIMFWTAVCAGGLVVVGATDANELSVVMIPFNLAAYLAVICGLTTIIRFPASLDSWLPLAAIPAVILLIYLGTFIELGDDREAFCVLFLVIGLGYGFYLLVRNIQRAMRTGFSLVVAVYHLASWVGWMVIGLLLFIFSHGWD
ncbi:MAG: hypothetical protein MK108_07165 [Mariniblastus sp.]|nr:hypothetical protein [Mariniblastus sp.]